MFRLLLLFCVFKFVWCTVKNFSDKKRTIVEVEVHNEWKACYIHSDRSYVIEMYLNKQIDIEYVSRDELGIIIGECEHNNMNTPLTGHQQAILRTKRSIMYPGTKWCGVGSIADGYNDLGVFVETDTCCRQHDQCHLSIPPLKTKFGLFNFAFWYTTHCTCDDKFYECLKASTEKIAYDVGYTFFNLLSIKCFVETGMTVKECVKRKWWGDCKKYKMVPEMQWRNHTLF